MLARLMDDENGAAIWMTFLVAGLFLTISLGWIATFREAPDRGYTKQGLPVPGAQHIWYIRMYPGQTSEKFETPYGNHLGVGDDFCLRWWVGPGADETNVSVEAQSNDDRWYPYSDKKNDGYRAWRNQREYVLTPIRFKVVGKDADVIFAWYRFSDGKCGFQGIYSRPPRTEPRPPPNLWQKLQRDFF